MAIQRTRLERTRTPLPTSDPLLAEIARILCLSERRLQRRLRDQLTLTQTATLLGFADLNTFFRCSKRWFGMSPEKYRLLRSKKNNLSTNTGIKRANQELSLQQR